MAGDATEVVNMFKNDLSCTLGLFRIWLRDKGQRCVLTILDSQQSIDPELRVNGRSA